MRTVRRYLVLYLPRLATDRIRQREPALAELRIATWITVGNRRLLTCVDAPGTTLHSGQALADAQAMYPDLILRPADPIADAAFLERLALWTIRYTPLASVDNPDGLVLDVTGCTDLIGGEAFMLQQVATSLERGGITVSAVLASGIDAAGALARAGHHGAVIPPGGEKSAAASIAITDLRISGDLVAALHRLGLQRVGDLLRQPRAPLARRFGRELMDVLDSLTGDRPRSLPPVRPPPVFSETIAFLEPIVTRLAIDRAMDTLLEPLCVSLVEAGQGAREVTLRAFRVDRDVQEISVGTGLPTRTPSHLRRLFANDLERLEPDLGFERMTLEAGIVNKMAAEQNAISTTGSLGDAARVEALAQLLDRLSQRLPVWRLAARESHWPERSVVRVGPFEPVAPHVRRTGQPVRLLSRPLPLSVVAEVPNGPPLKLRLDGTVHLVVRSDGPDRIEREWWRDDGESRRDYYRVELASGARLWIGRAGTFGEDVPVRWFLHGYMA
jgi:protein ImuB